jgi:hypothetical protein
MQQGNFSELIDPTFVKAYNNGVFVTVKDPLTGQPFPGNIIPTNKISSVSKNFINKYWSLPQLPGISGNSYFDVARPNQRDKYDIRVDSLLSQKHSLMARYGYSLYVDSGLTTGLTQDTQANSHLYFKTHNGAIAETFVINPHMTNEFKFGMSVMPIQGSQAAITNEDVMGSVGIQNTGGVLGLPGMTIAGFSGWASFVESNTYYDTRTVADALSVVHGRHFLKFGVQWNNESTNSTANTGTPTFSFDGSLSGFSWADFMLGLPNSVTRNIAPALIHYIARDWGFYAQDDVRATRDLTLSLGLRYQIWPTSYEALDRLSVFDPKKQAVIVPTEAVKKLVVPTFPTQLIPVLTPSEAGWPAKNRSLINTDLGAWAPRLGAAWQKPFGLKHTVLRGGFGIYYWNNRTNGVAGGGTVFSGNQTLTQQLVGGILTPIMQFPDPFSAFTSSAVNTLDPTTLTFSAVDPNLKLPYVEDWNVTVERELPGQTALRVSYMGSLEPRSVFSYNINEAPPGNLPFAQSRRPIPLARDINYTHNGGRVNSNLLQVIVDKPLRNGMSFDAAFTWFHKLQNTSAIGPGAIFNLDRFYANSSYATPRRQLILRYVWEVPVGRGRPFLSNLPAAAEAVLGGWKINGITKFETGQYLTATYNGLNPAGTTPGSGLQIPDRIGDGNFSRSVRAANAPNKPYFDVSAFVCPGGNTINGQPNLFSAGCPLSTPANVGRFGNSAIYELQGPGLNGWIVALAKEFRLASDSRRLEVTANATNPFNHANWAAPPTNLSSPATFGLITNTAKVGIDPYSAGRRRIYLGLRLTF